MKHIRLLTFGLLTAICLAMIPPSLAAAEPKNEVYAMRGDRELTVTLHYPDDWSPDDARSSIIFFYIGGWSAGSTEQFLRQADYLASRGMVTARADYRVKRRDGVTPDECVRDARTAVRWMKKNAGRLGIDPEKLVASGGSAGGHLAACTMIDDSIDAADDDLTISTRPAAMILFNPVLTFQTPQLKARLADRHDLADRISPIAFLDENTPPALILFGSDDKLLALAEPYWTRAKQLGVRADRFIADGQGHGFINRSPWQERTLIAADAFLVSLGLLDGQATVEVPSDEPTPVRRRIRNM